MKKAHFYQLRVYIVPYLLLRLIHRLCKSSRLFSNLIDTYFMRHMWYLDVYGKNLQYFQALGWNIIITRCSHELRLPMMEHCFLQSSGDVGAKDLLLWISAFATRSIREIRIIPGTSNSGGVPWTTRQTSSAILQIILDRYPSIQRLGLTQSPCGSMIAPTKSFACCPCSLKGHTKILWHLFGFGTLCNYPHDQ